MAEVYKIFNPADDIIGGDVQIVSTPLWSERINPLSQSYLSGVGFFTSSTQMDIAGAYYVDVYHRDPETRTDAEQQFALAYGNIRGSGSTGDPNTTGQNVNDTPSRAIYGQYRNLLLPPTDNQFTFGGVNPNDIFVINIQRARYRQKIDPGNWELRIGRGSTAANWTTNYVSLIDGSGAGENPNVNATGRVFAVYSGSGATTASGIPQMGLFYPDSGIIVLNASQVSASAQMNIWNSGSTSNTTKNHVELFKRISGSSYFAARSEEKINSTHYFVRITNKQFNFTNNPTFVASGSTAGAFLYPQMYGNPSVYITSVGLYDNVNRLLAVAKLSQPLLKSFQREVLIKVKLDY